MVYKFENCLELIDIKCFFRSVDNFGTDGIFLSFSLIELYLLVVPVTPATVPVLGICPHKVTY